MKNIRQYLKMALEIRLSALIALEENTDFKKIYKTYLKQIIR